MARADAKKNGDDTTGPTHEEQLGAQAENSDLEKHAQATIAKAVKAVAAPKIPFYLQFLLDAVLGYLAGHPELYQAVIQRILDWIHSQKPEAQNALADALVQYPAILDRAQSQRP